MTASARSEAVSTSWNSSKTTRVLVPVRSNIRFGIDNRSRSGGSAAGSSASSTSALTPSLAPIRRLGRRFERQLDVGADALVGADPEARPQAPPKSGEPGSDLPLELGRIRPLDPGADVGEREDPEEIDVDSVPALAPDRLAEPVEQ